MTSARGKVQVVVRSRRVPARLLEFASTQVSYPSAFVGTVRNRVVRYESRLDEEHLKAIEEGKKLADQMGLELEVIDGSRWNLFRRALFPFTRGRPPPPKLVITPTYSQTVPGARPGAVGGVC